MIGSLLLIVHGLSAVCVFGELVGLRLLICSTVFVVLSIGLVLTALIVKFATHLVIPGWAALATGLLLLILSRAVLLSLIFTFVVLYSRGQSSFVPLRDCPLYIREEKVVFTKHG